MKKGSAILWFVSVLLVLLVLTVSIPLTSAWSGSASLSPYTVHQGEPSSFTVTVRINDSRSTDVSWVWVHFGWQASGVGYYFKANDGTKDSISGYGSKNYTSTITVPQSALDQYSVEIRVRAQATGDWWAETKSSADYVDVIPIPTLQVSATGTPNSGAVPLTVSFNTTVSGGLSPYTYSWSFGDGSTSSLANPSHTYNSAGSYTAQVTVTDGASYTNRQIRSYIVTVTAITPTLQVSATGTPNSGTAPLTVNFQTIVGGGLPPYTYSWTFGDGSTSHTANPSHTYSSAGTYTAQVIVTDSASQTQTRSASITITVNPPPNPVGEIISNPAVIVLIIVVIIVAVVTVAVKKYRQAPVRRKLSKRR